jgi:hypothetical protein
MVGTCALNDMNAIVKMMGIFILIILLSIVVIYFMYCSHNKHSNILETFNDNVARVTDHNYGYGHRGEGKEDGDKKTIIGDITLRPCQVYFVGEEQHKKCDDDYNSEKSSTCKYEFKDDWKEIDTIKIGENTNFYPKKIYNQSYTKTDINNHADMAQCVKKFDESGTDKRYIYKNNELIGYNHGGSIESDTLDLNYRNTNSGKYARGNFISMKFGNNDTAAINYSNVIDSICSKKYVAPLKLQYGTKFFKFILNNDNKIIELREAELNPDMKSFTTRKIDIGKLLERDATKIKYYSSGNYFDLIQNSKISAQKCEIFKFNYNYLCNNEEGGIIKEYNIAEFTNNKTYLHMASNNSISVILKLNETQISIPHYAIGHFREITDTDTSAVLTKINTLKSTVLSTYNENPAKMKEKLERQIAIYGPKASNALKKKQAYGINITISDLLVSSFDVINKSADFNPDDVSIPTINTSLLTNFESGMRFAIIDPPPPNTKFKANIQKFENYDKNNIEHFQQEPSQSEMEKGTLESETRTVEVDVGADGPPPTGYNYCANENGTCACTGNVKYGLDRTDRLRHRWVRCYNYTWCYWWWGRRYCYPYRRCYNYYGNYYTKRYVGWRKKDSDGSISCNNATFGDPYRGQRKKCYCKPDPAQPEVSPFTNFKDGEDEHFQNFEDEYNEYEHFKDFKEHFATKTVSLIYKYKAEHGNYNQYFMKPKGQDFICDILIVGGGGGGGGFGGGGGGGEVLFAQDVTLYKDTRYGIYVGNGGAKARSYTGYNGSDGFSSRIVAPDVTIEAAGGGGGGSRHNIIEGVRYQGMDGTSSNGGSGGGGGHSNTTKIGRGGKSIEQSAKILNGKTFTSYGNDGGDGRDGTANGNPHHSAGGGGGAGYIGERAIQKVCTGCRGPQTGNGDRTWPNNAGGGDGGAGIDLSTFFGTNKGDNGSFGGGGGGMVYHNSGRPGYGSSYDGTHDNERGFGGGGDGGSSYRSRGKNGKDHTGGGGGGGQWNRNNTAGNGGSGIVIIRVKNYIRTSAYDEHKSAVDGCIDTGVSDDAEVECDEPFTNYYEKFTDLKVKPVGFKDGGCGAFVFLEKNKVYKNLKVSFTGIQSLNFRILNSTIVKINQDGGVAETLADITSGKVNFTPTSSGFYEFKCRFFAKSSDLENLESDIEIKCDGINLVDYMYIGDLWPLSWNSDPTLTASKKIYLFNEHLRDIKMEKNDSVSLSKFTDFISNKTNDFFNYNYWNDLLVLKRNALAKTHVLLDNNRCKYDRAAYNTDAKFTTNCNILTSLNDFKNKFNDSMTADNIKYLFRNKVFVKPSFVQSTANATFTSAVDNINNYITYEKHANVNDRTQKEHNGPYFNYYTDDNTLKCIYVKKIE